MTNIDMSRAVRGLIEAIGIAVDARDGEVPHEAWIELRVAPEGLEFDVHLQPDAEAVHINDAALMEALAAEDDTLAEQVIQEMLASRSYLQLQDDGLYHPVR